MQCAGPFKRGPSAVAPFAPPVGRPCNEWMIADCTSDVIDNYNYNIKVYEVYEHFLHYVYVWLNILNYYSLVKYAKTQQIREIKKWKGSISMTKEREGLFKLYVFYVSQSEAKILVYFEC